MCGMSAKEKRQYLQQLNNIQRRATYHDGVLSFPKGREVELEELQVLCFFCMNRYPISGDVFPACLGTEELNYGTAEQPVNAWTIITGMGFDSEQAQCIDRGHKQKPYLKERG